MPGRILPYTATETAVAAYWLPHLDGVRQAVADDPDASVEELDGVTIEEIDKLMRRGVISEGTARLLAETFDVEGLMGFGLGALTAALA